MVIFVNILIRYWKKFLYLLITGSTSIFIAACYGVQQGFGGLSEWVIKVQNKDNEPIKGLEVIALYSKDNINSIDTLDMQRTDSLGTAFITYEKDYHLKLQAQINDIDSTENGGFYSDTLVTKSEEIESIVTLSKQKK